MYNDSYTERRNTRIWEEIKMVASFVSLQTTNKLRGTELPQIYVGQRTFGSPGGRQVGPCSCSVVSISVTWLTTEETEGGGLTLRLLMSYIYIYGAPSKARYANVVYIWTYVWQR